MTIEDITASRACDAELNAWIERASPGERVIYHASRKKPANVSDHAWDACMILHARMSISREIRQRRQPIIDVARVAWRAALAGKVDLVQRRQDDGGYDYIAIRRASPHKASICDVDRVA